MATTNTPKQRKYFDVHVTFADRKPVTICFIRAADAYRAKTDAWQQAILMGEPTSVAIKRSGVLPASR